MPSSDALQSETPAPLGQSTARRKPGRPPKRKPTDTPSERGDSGLVERSPKKRRGRRRQSLVPDELALLSTANDASNEFDVAGDAYSKGLESAQDTAIQPAAADDGTTQEEMAQSGREEEEEEERGDMWMTNVLDDVMSGGKRSTKDTEVDDGLFSSAQAASPGRSPSLPGREASLPEVFDDYAPIMEHDEKSDAESLNSANQMRVEHQPSELADQRLLRGESDGSKSTMENGGRHVTRSFDGDKSSKRGDEPEKTLDPESFTMINIDSMLSFGQSRNLSPSDTPEMGETTSFFINQTLDSLREKIAGSDDDDVDILVSRDQTPSKIDSSVRDVMAPSTDKQDHSIRSPAVGSSWHIPGSHEKSPSLSGPVAGNEFIHEGRSLVSAKESSSGAGRWSEPNGPVHEDDSFSDIPEAALAAAELQEEFQLLRPRTAENLAAPAEEGVTNEVVNSLSRYPHRTVDQSSSRPASSDPTPSRADRTEIVHNNHCPQRSASRSARSRRAPGQQTMHTSSPPHSVRSRSDSNRLLTPPDETFSSVPSPASDAIAITEDRARDPDSDVIGSSPPEMAISGQDEPPTLPSRRNPDIPGDRKTLGRQPTAVVPQHSQPGAQRPALSPVVRIGRTLQNILSDPPSPSARSSGLGSPFKGSVRHSSPLDGAAIDEALQNVASADDSLLSSVSQSAPQLGQHSVQPSARAWMMALAPLSQVKSLVSQGAQLFTSPHVNKKQRLGSLGPSSPTTSKRLEGTRRSSFLDGIKQASREGSAYGNMVESRGSLDDNSEHHRVVHRANNVFSRSPGQLHPPSSDIDGSSSHTQQPAGITTRWDRTFEPYVDSDEVGRPQLRATQVSGQHSTESVKHISVEENSQRIPHDDTGLSEQAGQSLTEERMQSDGGITTEEQSDEEDIWTVEANRTASSPKYPVLPDETVHSFRKSGLSIDWRTRSTGELRNSHPTPSIASKSGNGVHVNAPENLEDYSLLDVHSGTSTQPSPKEPTTQGQKSHKKVDLSDFFSSSPNFLERQRRAKKAWLAKPPTAQPTASVVQSAAKAKKNKPTDSVLRSSSTQSVATDVSDRANQDLASRTTFDVTPERNSIPRLPQQDFTPRQRQNDAKLFESWAVSSQIPTPDPAFPNPPQLTQPDTPRGAEDSSFDTPDLRPLPGRAVSPSKSCLRSPLKPKTPGRVVDFTSSVLSTAHPIQAEARYDNRSLTTSNSQPLLPSTLSSGKENERAILNHPSGPSSPGRKHISRVHQERPRQQHSGSPLSQTRWSRKHWLLLDDLLQGHRRNPLGFQLLHSDAIMTSPHKRSSNNLLGKHVTSQGVTLILEQWHLDITDSFRKEVGGWPEEVIAKRLFALIVGEERRRLGIVPKRR